VAAPGAAIDTIVDQLHSKTYLKTDVKAAVRIELEYVLPIELAKAPLFGKQADNQKFAEDVGGLVRKLLRKLEGAPVGTRNVIYILASRTEHERWSLGDPNSPAAKHFKEKLQKVLADLQRGCADILRNKGTIGDYHTLDRAKQLCAGCALDLIVGLDAGKPTNSTRLSPIRIISRNLYEAIAGGRSAKWLKSSQDLREQCVDVIAHWRRLSDADRRAHIDQLWSNWESTGMIARKSGSSS
jgi:hypothetical protein